jgi:hypothetical protein
LRCGHGAEIEGGAVNFDRIAGAGCDDLAGASDRSRAIDDERRRIAADDDRAVVDETAGRELSGSNVERRALVYFQKPDRRVAANVVI